ncbi:unnamed protein product [Protopolystoma xenopodis]|uniref:Uncharacterized protein n=1 Tax=Protopolystoma xenopodis TaxID=117903 RepID=A0A3S5FG86_9PLAT|nr:unnamed protein product [Protopolystoma xenopodis]
MVLRIARLTDDAGETSGNVIRYLEREQTLVSSRQIESNSISNQKEEESELTRLRNLLAEKERIIEQLEVGLFKERFY